MFWRFGGYASISTIDTILDKPGFALEDLLEDADLLQELKQQNAKLVEYLRKDQTLQRLLEYVTAPKLEPVVVVAPEPEPESDGPGLGLDKGKTALVLPFSRPRASSRLTIGSDQDDDEEAEKRRNRYAFVAAEVLASDTWSIYEALMESRHLLVAFWKFLKRPSPLDPLQASYFTKVNEALFDRKTEEMLVLLKSIPDAVADMLRHVDSPMIMDLLLKIIALDRVEGGQGTVEWLYSRDVIPTLLSCLSPDNNWIVQTAAGDFLKAIITISANASQNEQQCIGPNELTRQLVSRPCVEQLIRYMLTGGNPLTVGVGVVIEVIRKNNSDYDPDVGAESAGSAPSSRDPIYLGTLLRLFAEHVPDFMELIMNAPPQKKGMASTFGDRIEPLGFDRFKTCELMAELLHCSNMALLNEVGAEELIAARDSERQRLRTEGQLFPQRPEDIEPPAEDLTLRHSLSSPEESRRLEVTNADDDGFEEVEPSRGMTEDTSHEFVRAEEEILPAARPLSDKDEEEFVDEPLSSPRLSVREIKVVEQTFEDADLVVAPLSPKKIRQPEEDTSSQTAATSEPRDEPSRGDASKAPIEALEAGAAIVTSKPEHPEEKDPVESEVDDVVPDDGSDSSVVYTPAASEPDSNTADPSIPVAIKSPTARPPQDAIPESKGTPASSIAALSSSENLETGPIKEPESPDAASASSTGAAPTAESSKPVEDVEISKMAETGEPAKTAHEGETESQPQQYGDDSIIVNNSASNMDVHDSPPIVAPVVGDYLKIQLVDYRVVPTILSFFFKYPWNNFLHNVVYDIVQQVFNGPMDRGYNPTLAVSLFGSADVTAAIIRGQALSDESQAKSKTRMGYMGHLTLIAEEVVKFTERHPPELLSDTVLDRVMSEEWINYVEGPLAETRERDNGVLGGVRPEVASANRPGMGNAVGLSSLGPSLSLGQVGSSALADAGLNGNVDLHDSNSNGIGPFAISAGTLMSGFGSSSDEEDDDTEDDEDVASEFRAYTDPLNNNSLNPPSIPPPPPPPPPLNIPPSRARLQLAARLAMHKNNAAANASTMGSSGIAGSSSASTAESSGDAGQSVEGSTLPSLGRATVRNPFDDDADEVDSDDGDDYDNDEEAEDVAGRGSWWRGVVMRGGHPDGMDSDDDIEDEEEDDEEFGDFAMPEAESPPKSASNNIILKPLPVHPPQTSKTAFSSLWPFTGPGFGAVTGVKEQDKGTVAAGESGVPFPDLDDKVLNEDGLRVSRAVEAKRRTSLEDPDDEEVVV